MIVVECLVESPSAAEAGLSGNEIGGESGKIVSNVTKRNLGITWAVASLSWILVFVVVNAPGLIDDYRQQDECWISGSTPTVCGELYRWFGMELIVAIAYGVGIPIALLLFGTLFWFFMRINDRRKTR